MNDFDNLHISPPDDATARSEAQTFRTYTHDGMCCIGTLGYGATEIAWGEPQPIAVGTVIGGGVDVFTGAGLPRLMWDGERWTVGEVTGDER